MSGELDNTVIGGIIGNIVSVVGVVITNKYIVGVDGFNFMVLLSFFHFSFTALGTRILLHGRYFEYKDAAFSNVLPVSMGSLMSVAFMNLNLSHNSVGFYQLSKLICIPVTLAIQYFAYKQTVSRLIQFTLVPILFGVGFAFNLCLSYSTLVHSFVIWYAYIPFVAAFLFVAEFPNLVRFDFGNFVIFVVFVVVASIAVRHPVSVRVVEVYLLVLQIEPCELHIGPV